jgi:hypothetical protein
LDEANLQLDRVADRGAHHRDQALEEGRGLHPEQGGCIVD